MAQISTRINRIQLDNLPGGFDALLRNQLRLPPHTTEEASRGLTILIRGEAGTGKTTLALQIAFHLTCKTALGKGLYCSLEQDAQSLRYKLASMFFHQIERSLAMKEELRWDGSLQGGGIQELWCKVYRYLSTVREKTADKLALSERESLIAKIERAFGIESFPLSFYEYPQQPPGPQIPLFSGNLERGMSIVSTLFRQEDQNPPCRWPVLIVDGLATMPVSQRKVLGLDRLFDLVKSGSSVGIIVYEPAEEAEEQNLDHLADMVIELREHPLEGSVKYLINEMHILKARYQDPARGWHQYKIRSWGLEFFPSIHFQVHMPSYMPVTYASSLGPLGKIAKTEANAAAAPGGGEKSKSILEGLVGGMDDGCVAALLGSRGSFKSQLCIDFLTAGALDSKDGLFISLIDNFKNLNENMLCPRVKCDRNCAGEKASCKEFIHLFYQRPGCITPAEFLYYVKKRLDVKAEQNQRQLNRLVFWDLTQLDYRFPMFLDDSMFIPALLDTLKFSTANPGETSARSPEIRPLRSVIMGAGNARYTRAVSAMADTVLYCWRDLLSDGKRLINCYANPDGVRTDLGVDKGSELDIDKELDKEPDKKEVAETGTPPECLLVYVDRRERHHEMGHNSLYLFPVMTGQLCLPKLDWTAERFSTEPGFFVNARTNIRKIHLQQGLE